MYVQFLDETCSHVVVVVHGVVVVSVLGPPVDAALLVQDGPAYGLVARAPLRRGLHNLTKPAPSQVVDGHDQGPDGDLQNKIWLSKETQMKMTWLLETLPGKH